jgi:hypothetical protein
MKKIIFAAFVCAFIGGCYSSSLQVQNISGTITYQGKPVSDAVITFVALSPSNQGASGISDSNGSYILATPGAKKDGAMIGEYHVFISKKIPADTAGNPIKEEPVIIPEGRPETEAQNENENLHLLKSLIPEKYADSSKPILKVNIIKGKNICNFQLED